MRGKVSIAAVFLKRFAAKKCGEIIPRIFLPQSYILNDHRAFFHGKRSTSAYDPAGVINNASEINYPFGKSIGNAALQFSFFNKYYAFGFGND